MQKSLRSIVLATLSLAAVPAVHAGIMGTDPRPVAHVVAPGASQTILRATLALLGF